MLQVTKYAKNCFNPNLDHENTNAYKNLVKVNHFVFEVFSRKKCIHKIDVGVNE